MQENIRQALAVVLEDWNRMATADHEDADWTAERFEASFYKMIDAVRDWTDNLEPRPQTLAEFWQLPEIEEIVERLPAPLQLNFETEAELIVEKIIRIDDEKYD
ncbi:hypothetical protein [Brevibacillus fulvus]|uniref:Uncharacterized protein n=1 Tax=Brevibacillus fulvus TaxID=1125967 RepID=A0A938Y0Z7_9BACL|nr:hypothetical protein [Brevibacillus fulvus]MBM7591356.1 hypothetical protein [Brevibacillus fulvus]